jgi:hypothetical protein
MAAAKILTHLLRQDNIPYKTRPVASLGHIKETAVEIADLDIRTVILLNCGAVSTIYIYIYIYIYHNNIVLFIITAFYFVHARCKMYFIYQYIYSILIYQITPCYSRRPTWWMCSV